MLTDGYKIIEDGFISLSGKSVGASGVAAEKIAALLGGDAIVEFKNIDTYAKNLISEKLGKEYIENDEGFIIEVCDKVIVYADTDRAKLFAACSIYDKYDGKMNKGLWWSFPSCSHRSLRIFLPPKDDLDYFYKLIDSIVHLGYNSILLEICGGMEFKKHPEVNEGWIKYCSSMNVLNEKMNYAQRAYYRVKNSIHTCNAGGGVYSQEEMKEIINYCRERFIEIVPEVPSLSHSEYFLVSHPELRECEDEPFASTACPSNPDLYKLVFDLYDEVIDVFEPKAIHIGHDEWYSTCVCDKCKGKNPAKVFAEDVLKSYNYLKEKGIKTYMWADKLLRVAEQSGEVHGGAEKHIYSVPTKGDVKSIEIMGTDYPVYDQYWFDAPDWVKKEGFHQVVLDTADCIDLLPDDIMYCNWYFFLEPRLKDELLKRGKDMIYGNFVSTIITSPKKRFELGAKGLSISSWAETSKICTQLWGTTFELGYGSIIAWNHERTELDHIQNMHDTFDGLFKLWNRETLSSKHLEVTHTVTKSWPEGRKYAGKMSKFDPEFLTLGAYEVTYKDGTKEEFPVMFCINISYSTARLERCMSPDKWMYKTDLDICCPASCCTVSQDEGKMWYSTVMPLSGEVEKCEYVPKCGFEDYVSVKSIEIK